MCMYLVVTLCYQTRIHLSIYSLHSAIYATIRKAHRVCMEVVFRLAGPVDPEPRAEPFADIVHLFRDSVVSQPIVGLESQIGEPR